MRKDLSAVISLHENAMIAASQEKTIHDSKDIPENRTA